MGAGYIFLEQCTKKNYSLVIRLIDDFTVGEPIGEIKVWIRDSKIKAVKDLSEVFIFTNLKADCYLIAVESDFYFPDEINVLKEDFTAEGPVVKELVLLPKANYPFSNDTTLIRAMVEKADKSPVTGIIVQTVMLPLDAEKPEYYSKARCPDEVKTGQSLVRLVDLAGPLISGDWLMFADGDEDKREFCQIAGLSPEEPAAVLCKLVDNLSYNHPPRTHLMPVVHTKTTEKGELVIYFRTVKKSSFQAQITILNSAVKQVVTVNEGTLISLGTLLFEPAH